MIIKSGTKSIQRKWESILMHMRIIRKRSQAQCFENTVYRISVYGFHKIQRIRVRIRWIR